MSKPNQLFLLADHVKLSLLERQRAQALNLESDSQDGHISRSLDQFREGLEALKAEEARLLASGDKTNAQAITDALPSLNKQYSDLTSQFHGFPSATAPDTLTHPNDAALSPDFAHAQTLPSTSTRKPNLRSPSSSSLNPKTVRFSDSPLPPADPAADELFGPYRDDPSRGGGDTAGYRDQAAGLDNQQVHEYHSQIMREQDDHLDRLGESIGRQRELSMQIGDELDSHVAMLDDVDAATDRQQSRLDRASRSLGRVSRAAGESKQMCAIIALIIILVLLIAVLK
ncbi:v-SNARE [Plectosphaerella cucumerina]|uniref:V-SNARE n=1 Tax=Plectosphaerella cucumerina TaxID=40658 RepID=A0A8K0TH15_9PEZI|nr:v-SNARE [Plectosphaerella cucumerina]